MGVFTTFIPNTPEVHDLVGEQTKSGNHDSHSAHATSEMSVRGLLVANRLEQVKHFTHREMDGYRVCANVEGRREREKA